MLTKCCIMRSSSHIVGIGLRGACPHGLKCWLYFPEGDCPFYRTTVFSHYAPANCPASHVALPTLCLVCGHPSYFRNALRPLMASRSLAVPHELACRNNP